MHGLAEHRNLPETSTESGRASARMLFSFERPGAGPQAGVDLSPDLENCTVAKKRASITVKI
jgi:hypothetical protein